MKLEVDVLCECKATQKKHSVRVQELCESGGGRPGLPVPSSPTFCVNVKQHRRRSIASELRSCVKEEVDVLGSPSLIVRTVSVDVKRL